MRRRTLLGALLAVAAAFPLVRAGRRADPPAMTPAAYAEPTGGSGTATLGTWVALPNSGGLQVHCTTAVGKPAKVPVRWTFNGPEVTVTADYPTPVTVRAVPVRGGQHVSTGPGYALTVRVAP